MSQSQPINDDAVISNLPQPELYAPAPAPASAPALTPAPTAAQVPDTAPAAPPPNRIPEHLMHKNRLQEYTQRCSVPLPVYRTVNEGYQHAPKFRSTVLVDGATYTSPNTFSHRRAAEQDVAKLALECISKKIKDEGCPLINEDTVFCKSILNEFAVKMNMEMPTYRTIQSEGLLPVFVSSLVFNGIAYNGEIGRNKKEAEQLAARAVIRSLLGTSGFATILSEIIKSKTKLYAALNKVKKSNYSTQNIATSNVLTAAIPEARTGKYPTAAIPDARVGMHPTAAIPDARAGMHPAAAIPDAREGMYPTVAIPEARAGMHPTAAIPGASAGMHQTAAIPGATAGMHPTAAAPEATAGMHPTAAAPGSSAGMHPTAAAPGSSAGMHPTAAAPESSAGMDPTAAAPEATAGMHPTAAAPGSSAGMHPTAAAPEATKGMNLQHHQFKIPKLEPSSEPIDLPISFVPPGLGQPSGVGPNSTNKRRKNKRKANKKLRTDAPLCVAAQPLTQAPPCSVAQ